MRIDLVAESIPERVALAVGAVPTPLLHTQMAMLLAQAVMEATRGGVFEALAGEPRSADEVAEACDFDAAATTKLLVALVACGYLTAEGERFALSKMARKWMLAESPVSQRDKTIFALLEAVEIGRLGAFLKKGAAPPGHTERDAEFWKLYQSAMRSLASLSTSEVAARTYVPKGATRMADLGGSHGLFSVALCRRYPALSATIIDLPDAIAAAAPLLAKEALGARVQHVAGDLLDCELGEATYDLLFLSNVVHHFDEPTNRALMRRIARALRPGGAVVVQDAMRFPGSESGGQIGALLALQFSVISGSNIWSFAEIAEWQRGVGLTPRAPLKLRSLPGGGQQTAVRARA